MDTKRQGVPLIPNRGNKKRKLGSQTLSNVRAATNGGCRVTERLWTVTCGHRRETDGG